MSKLPLCVSRPLKIAALNLGNARSPADYDVHFSIDAYMYDTQVIRLRLLGDTQAGISRVPQEYSDARL